MFEVIFCRNLLIYFDRAGQEQAVSALRRSLTPKGALFVGPSEPSLLLGLDFVSAKVPRAFAFHRAAKGSSIIDSERAVAIRQGSNSRPQTQPHLRKPGTAIQKGPGQVGLPAEPGCKPETGIGDAISLANQGCLAEAEKLCEEQLRKHGASAQALYLIGLIRDARGETSEASQYYRKALYLDQDHEESLGHLALLLSKQGDIAGARVLRHRLSRIQHKRAK
jgi:chemotaxis protein methyltransferase WspC